VCITFSTGKNSPIRNTFFDDSRTIATGKPLYSPRSAPSFFTMFIVTSRMFLPHDAPTPGSCMIVFARSMGFVASTARQDASAEFGMETQPGNCSLFVFRVTASRLGSVSVLRRFGDDALDIAFERARRSRASDAVEGIARAARASGEKAVRVFRWRALALGASRDALSDERRAKSGGRANCVGCVQKEITIIDRRRRRRRRRRSRRRRGNRSRPVRRRLRRRRTCRRRDTF